MVDEPRRESCKAQPAHREGAGMPPQPATAMAAATGTGTRTGSGLYSAGLPGRLAREMQADGAPETAALVYGHTTLNAPDLV